MLQHTLITSYDAQSEQCINCSWNIKRPDLIDKTDYIDGAMALYKFRIIIIIIIKNRRKSLEN